MAEEPTMTRGLGSRRAAADVYQWSGPRPVREFRGWRIQAPSTIHRVDSFATMHLASYDAVRAALPTDDLYPVRWLDGRAVIGIVSLRYRDVTARTDDGRLVVSPNYAEIDIEALVTQKQAPRVAPLLRGSPAGFVLHLPVTNAVAAQAGRDLYGFPKFVADMDFVEAAGQRSVTLAEGGVEILRQCVRPRGRVSVTRAPAVSFTSFEGDLLEVRAPFVGYRQKMMGAGCGHLELGEHPVAARIRGLDVDPEPILAASDIDGRMVFGAGVPAGKAGPYSGYIPADEPELGRYTIAYPDTAPLDQHAIALDIQILSG